MLGGRVGGAVETERLGAVLPRHLAVESGEAKARSAALFRTATSVSEAARQTAEDRAAVAANSLADKEGALAKVDTHLSTNLAWT